MGEEDCNIGLALCIGRGGGEEFTLSGGHQAKAKVKVKVKPPVQFDLLFPLKVEEGKEEVQSKKKLRLTKDQSSVLEDCFRTQHTLSPAQKYGIARQLNLRPRQVEVWFQNRRARTKLKQTEVDCKFLKRCCERLTDENQRLKRELMEVRLEIQKTAMITVCPRCEEKTMDEVKSAKDWRMNMNPSKEYKLCL